MKSKIDVKNELSIVLSLNFISIYSKIVFIIDSFRKENIFLKILNKYKRTPSFIFILSNLSTRASVYFFKALGYFLKNVSNNIKILIWICCGELSNKFNKGFCISSIATLKLISLMSLENISFNILNISGLIKSLFVLSIYILNNSFISFSFKSFPQLSIKSAIAFDVATFISESISCALNFGNISSYKVFI